MKLDEVIEILERQIDKTRIKILDKDLLDSVPDALYYLREYRTEQKILSDSKEHYEYWEHKYYAELEKNDPLTWDELRSMEGKPVWVEVESLSIGVSPYWKGWYIIRSFSDDEFMHCNDGYEWAKEMQGRMWQAYRKERG